MKAYEVILSPKAFLKTVIRYFNVGNMIAYVKEHGKSTLLGLQESYAGRAVEVVFVALAAAYYVAMYNAGLRGKPKVGPGRKC